MRDRSEIVTNATQDATGGNIFIYLKDNLLGLENSQIAASAERGSGGNIQIATRGIFLSADSQINATSEFGIDGLIQIDTLAVDPNSGLIKLPTELIDPSLYLSQGCSGNKDNQFMSIGRGGLPENPFHAVIYNSVLPDWGTSSEPTILKPSSKPHTSTFSNISPIIEAQNWKINQNRKVELFVISIVSMELN